MGLAKNTLVFFLREICESLALSCLYLGGLPKFNCVFASLAAAKFCSQITNLCTHSLAKQVVDTNGCNRDKRHNNDVLSHTLTKLLLSALQHNSIPKKFK